MTDVSCHAQALNLGISSIYMILTFLFFDKIYQLLSGIFIIPSLCTEGQPLRVEEAS